MAGWMQGLGTLLRLIGCMKKKCLLLIFILLSSLCLRAFPLEAEAGYARSFSFLEKEGTRSLFMGDEGSIFLGYKTKAWSAGLETSVFYMEEIKSDNLFLSLGNLGGFSVRAALVCAGETLRAKAEAGLSFYSMNLDSRAFFSMLSARAEVLVRVVGKEHFSLLTGLSLTAEAGCSRKEISIGLVTTVIYGGSLGGRK